MEQNYEQQANPQSTSIFFRLPTELRCMIYDQVFFGITITVPTRKDYFALLRTCQRLEAEIDTRWMRCVLFRFRHGLEMGQTLCRLPAHKLSQIRYIYTQKDRKWRGGYEALSSVLRRARGLQLDRLIVLSYKGNISQGISYKLVTRLITESRGWKVLYYRTEVCRIDFAMAQPGTWQRLLDARDQRDAEGFRSRVTMWALKTPSVVTAESRIRLNPNIDLSSKFGKFGISYAEFIALCSPQPVIIVVERGIGVDYKKKEVLGLPPGCVKLAWSLPFQSR